MYIDLNKYKGLQNMKFFFIYLICSQSILKFNMMLEERRNNILTRKRFTALTDLLRNLVLSQRVL